MPWRETQVQEERLRFNDEYRSGEWSMKDLCDRFGISRKTGYKYVARYKEYGLGGLKNWSRAPHVQAQRVSEQVEGRILKLKKRWRTWGAPKLRDWLLLNESDQQWPAVSTIHRILERHDLVRREDADLEYNPEDYNYLLKPILDGTADVVYGSRFRGGAAHRVDRFWHTVGNRCVTLLSNMFTDLNLTDMETCYKVFRREVLDGMKLRCNRFDFEPEFTAKIARATHNGKRWRVYEVGISYAGRRAEEGKKISWLDGFPALWAIVKYRSNSGWALRGASPVDAPMSSCARSS